MKQPIRFFALLVVLAALALAACGGSAETPTPEVQVVVVTATNEPADEAPEEEVEEESAEEGVFVTVIQDLNMRAGDTTSHDVMTVIPGGSSVEVTGKNSAGTWYQVSYHDATGWISASYAEGEVPADLPVVQAPPASSSSSSSDDSSSGGDSSSSSSGSSGSSDDNGGDDGDDTGGGDTGGTDSGAQTAPSDSDIFVDVNIKNHTSTHTGAISYPDGDNTDRVYVDIVGFDSITTSGDVSFTLSCSGDGVGDVQVNAGTPTNGTVGCNSNWEDFYTNVNDSQTITISLGSGSDAYVEWTLIISANN